jgi:hypothetical protein
MQFGAVVEDPTDAKALSHVSLNLVKFLYPIGHDKFLGVQWGVFNIGLELCTYLGTSTSYTSNFCGFFQTNTPRILCG